MNVQQLRYLVAVSDSGSVSAAVRSLGVTQPVISRSVRAFEVEHGMSVFCLSGRRLVPTAEGKAVVDSARDALAAIGVVGETARAAGGQAELVIATTPTNGLLLTTALSDLGRCEPNLEITVCRASDGDDVLRKVRSREAEIGFAELTPRQLIANLSRSRSLRWRSCWYPRLASTPRQTQVPRRSRTASMDGTHSFNVTLRRPSGGAGGDGSRTASDDSDTRRRRRLGL